MLSKDVQVIRYVSLRLDTLLITTLNGQCLALATLHHQLQKHIAIVLDKSRFLNIYVVKMFNN